jgi:hypothetical protein
MEPRLKKDDIYYSSLLPNPVRVDFKFLFMNFEFADALFRF